MARIHDIATYTFAPQERLFYDTNVWAAINQLARFSTDSTPYTAAHKRVLTVGASVHVDSLVLQEFANVMERDVVASLRKSRLGKSNSMSGPELKQFRKTALWPEAASVVSAALRQILSQAVQLTSKPDFADIAAYEMGQEGFNDHLIARLCQTHGLKLLTNDTDFRAFDVEIITALPSLLAFGFWQKRVINYGV